jgi:hypothetical protein
MTQVTGRTLNVRNELPAIVGVEASRVRYNPPRRFYVGRDAVEVRDAVELLVRTAAALPIRDITPVLFIGETAISDYETVSANLYRFFVFNLDRIAVGAPIGIGWPYAPTSVRMTQFRFQIPRNLPIS